ncbi:MAG: hypothetical protein C4314_05565 [Thermoflexus sp.]
MSCGAWRAGPTITWSNPSGRASCSPASRPCCAATRPPPPEASTTTQEVRVDGRPVELTPTEFRLLATMARFPGRPLTHEFLLREVWGEEHTQDRSYLKLYIWYLRQKIEPDPEHPLFIRTERGIGYRLVGPDELSPTE